MRGAAHLALGAAVVTGLGAVVATIWVGSLVKERAVVERPYEEGLRHDADRRARASLGWDVSVAAAPPGAGPAALAFEVKDGRGAPVEGAAVTVSVHRPDTSRDAASAASRDEGKGRYVAEVSFPAPGPWLVAFEIARGGERVHVERTIEIPAEAGDPCRLERGPCTRRLAGGGAVTIDLAPRPLRTMRELDVSVDVEGAPPGARVEVSFAMAGMDMGTNRARLAPSGPGRFAGRAVLVRCPSGRRDWTAEVSVRAPGAAPRAARFDLAVAE